jgi:hypothetical protein
VFYVGLLLGSAGEFAAIVGRVYQRVQVITWELGTNPNKNRSESTALLLLSRRLKEKTSNFYDFLKIK